MPRCQRETITSYLTPNTQNQNPVKRSRASHPVRETQTIVSLLTPPSSPMATATENWDLEEDGLEIFLPNRPPSPTGLDERGTTSPSLPLPLGGPVTDADCNALMDQMEEAEANQQWETLTGAKRKTREVQTDQDFPLVQVWVHPRPPTMEQECQADPPARTETATETMPQPTTELSSREEMGTNTEARYVDREDLAEALFNMDSTAADLHNGARDLSMALGRAIDEQQRQIEQLLELTRAQAARIDELCVDLARATYRKPIKKLRSLY